MVKAIDVLIVDDNETCCLMLQGNLQALGLTVQYVLQGKKAVEVVKQKRPKLLILDIYIPTLDGFEILRELKKASELPFIIAISQDPVAIECIEHLGANEAYLKENLESIVGAVKKRFSV